MYPSGATRVPADYCFRGFKQVVIGGRTRKPCSDDRFQPFIFWTNGSSRCEYKRSECNEEERAKTGWLGIRIMYPSGATRVPADYCFSELAL
jgi:hypothetical protein